MANIVTFVIPTLNEETYLQKCVLSIKNLNKPEAVDSFQVIVVDSGSKDNTLAIAAKLNVESISVPQKSISFSRNQGATHARGGFLAFIDADCSLHKNWLIYGIKHLSKKVNVAYGSDYASPPKDATWVEKVWHKLSVKTGGKEWRQVDWLPTFNLLIKREAFFDVGGFNEDLITCEDADLSYRLKKYGSLILENKAPTHHFRNSKTINEFFRREAWRGRSNLSSFFQHQFVPSELPSLLFPFIFVLALISGIISIALIICADLRGGVSAFAWFIVLSQPVLLLFRNRYFKEPITFWPAGYFLIFLYLLARGLALFIPVRR